MFTKHMNFIQVCILLAMITTSWDHVANIDIVFNFRFTQFIMLPVFMFYTLHLLFGGRTDKILGGAALFTWVLFQAVFMFRSPEFSNTFGYFLWLIFSVMTIAAVTHYTDRLFTYEWLIKAYLNSFVLIAYLGLFQFVLARGFGISFLNNQSPRISGFCYEPSYFATYMITGLVTFSYMIIKKDESVFKLPELKRKFWTIALVMLLSTARTGWLNMALWFFITPWFDEKSKGFLSGRKLIMIILGLLVCIGAFMALMILRSYGLNFLGGTGIDGEASHSERTQYWIPVWNAFLDSPFLGYSLGGVDPILAQRAGRAYITGNNGSGCNVWLETLIASGLIGMIPFVLYFTRIFERNKYYLNGALKWGLIFIMIALCLNQNILRPYFWWHIAIISACYKHNKLKLKSGALALT